jgi:hypothetical protein
VAIVTGASKKALVKIGIRRMLGLRTDYQTDLKILDEIRNYLRRYGVRRLSDSEALRLACRTIVFNEKLLTTYENMRVDDGRRKRK